MADSDVPSPVRLVTKVLNELGLVSVYNSPLDTKLLCLQRFVRLFAYGGATLVLVSYLAALGIPDERIGLFMTLTLVGDVIISFILTIFADGLGRKTVLAVGAALMIVSGVVFGLSGNYWVLLTAAIFGVISPSGNEIGPFRAIEESTLAHLTPAAIRSDIFAWYALIGQAGAAFGLMTCGWVVHALEQKDSWDSIHAYRVIFFGYAAVGAIKVALALALSHRIEAEATQERNISETTPLIGDNINSTAPEKKSTVEKLKALLPHITPESRKIFIPLASLFALDSFASGLVSLSWVVTFFQRKFSIDSGRLGSLFFTTSIISALSTLVASSLARRFGNIKTMVFTHFPSSISLALIPFPTTLPFAIFFLILRHSTSSMDVAPRSAFLAAVVLPHERTAVMGAINVIKTGVQSLGPFITGILAGRNQFWVVFVIAGACKATYDLGILVVFAGHKPREEEHLDARAALGAEAAAARNGDEP